MTMPKESRNTDGDKRDDRCQLADHIKKRKERPASAGAQREENKQQKAAANGKGRNPLASSAETADAALGGS